jgi:hypothetical protein
MVSLELGDPVADLAIERLGRLHLLENELQRYGHVLAPDLPQIKSYARVTHRQRARNGGGPANARGPAESSS